MEKNENILKVEIRPSPFPAATALQYHLINFFFTKLNKCEKDSYFSILMVKLHNLETVRSVMRVLSHKAERENQLASLYYCFYRYTVICQKHELLCILKVYLSIDGN